MKPTVGRIVLYTNLGDRDGKYPPEVQAAIITKVIPLEGPALHQRMSSAIANEESAYAVSLHIFYEMGQFDMKDVPFTNEVSGSEGARGKWAWPSRQS